MWIARCARKERFVTPADDMSAELPDATTNESSSHARTEGSAAAPDAPDAAKRSGSASRRRQTARSASTLERFLRWAAGSGAQHETVAAPGITDEPLPYGTEVDWGRALDLAMRRRDSERGRLERIEGKIAPIIGGTIAGLALFVDKAASPIDYGTGALLLVPLAMLFFAFRTYEYIDTPNLDELVRTYERWPLTYIRSVVLGTANAVSTNGRVIDRKARDLNRTMAVLFAVVTVIIASRAYEAVSLQHVRTAVARAANAAPANLPRH